VRRSLQFLESLRSRLYSAASDSSAVMMLNHRRWWGLGASWVGVILMVRWQYRSALLLALGLALVVLFVLSSGQALAA
jgi:hypothetical protein